MNGLVINQASPRHSKGDKVSRKIISTKKADEINLLAKINSSKDLKQLAEDFGMTREQIKKQL